MQPTSIAHRIRGLLTALAGALILTAPLPASAAPPAQLSLLQPCVVGTWNATVTFSTVPGVESAMSQLQGGEVWLSIFSDDTFEFRYDQMTVNMPAGPGVVTLTMDGVSTGRLVEVEPGVLGGATEQTTLRHTISAPGLPSVAQEINVPGMEGPPARYQCSDDWLITNVNVPTGGQVEIIFSRQ